MRSRSARQPWTRAAGKNAFAPVAGFRQQTAGGSLSRRAAAVGSRPRPAPRVDVAVSCEWAERAVACALREAGAIPVPIGGRLREAASRPGVALVYDLSPWDWTAVSALHDYSAQARAPVLLYLPPTGSAFAMLSQIRTDATIDVQIQSRNQDCLEHLGRAAQALIGGVPRVRIMSLMSRAMPGMSSAAFLFGHRALSVLGSGHRPTVGSLARALGFSPRTLQRRFAAEGLPSPKTLLDWLTLAHIHATAETRELSLAKAAARSKLTGNDLYRLRKRVGRRRWALAI